MTTVSQNPKAQKKKLEWFVEFANRLLREFNEGKFELHDFTADAEYDHIEIPPEVYGAFPYYVLRETAYSIEIVTRPKRS